MMDCDHDFESIIEWSIKELDKSLSIIKKNNKDCMISLNNETEYPFIENFVNSTIHELLSIKASCSHIAHIIKQIKENQDVYNPT